MIRFFDIVLSSIAILVLLPFMLPIMIALKLTGEHYIFYLQPRIGRHGRPFMILKFATMLKDSPNLPGGFITQERDPRILPMGNFLRKTKINELPQLVNILLGQMSFVGPRPVVQSHIDLYPDDVKAAILSRVPGLTGIGSLVFRDEEAVLNRLEGDRKFNHDRVVYPYKGQLELWYSEHRSLFTYFAIIFLTAWAVAVPSSTLYRKFFKDLPAAQEPLNSALGDQA